MGKGTGNLDYEDLISWSDDLVSFLNDSKDADELINCIHDHDGIRSICDSHFDDAQFEFQECEKRIEECKRETEKIKSQVVDDFETVILQEELKSHLEEETLLKEELSVVLDEIANLEQERLLFENQEQDLKKVEQEEFKSLKKLSMYASVTNIIPYLEDGTRISGHILRRERKLLEKFGFDTAEITPFDICQTIWKMVD